jgi:ribosomal protein S28E/S33
LLSLLNYNPWKIRGSNTGQHGEITNAKTKIAEHRETSLMTARGIADLMVMFRYGISGVMVGAGTLGAIHCEIHEQTGDEGNFTAVRGDLTMTLTHN